MREEGHAKDESKISGLVILGWLIPFSKKATAMRVGIRLIDDVPFRTC